MDREKYMTMALDLAREAAAVGEIPVGCIIADKNGKIIGRGRNTRQESRCALGLSALTAIDKPCRNLGD